MTRRHELDPISLTFGFVFTGLGLLFLLGRADQALRLQWVWPLLLLALGAGILFDVTRGRRRPDPEVEIGPNAEVGPEGEVGVAREVGTEVGVGPEVGGEVGVGVGGDSDPDPKPAVDNREHLD